MNFSLLDDLVKIPSDDIPFLAVRLEHHYFVIWLLIRTSSFIEGEKWLEHFEGQTGFERDTKILTAHQYNEYVDEKRAILTSNNRI